MGFIQKLFGRKEVQFQKQILSVLEKEFAHLEPSNDPLRIRIGETELNLSFLYDKCQKNQVQSSELIQQYFSFPIALSARREYDWNEAESKMRPQLVPVEIARQFGIQLFDFADPIAASVVIHDGLSQTFVRPSDLQKWNVSQEELLNLSIANLNSHKVEMEVTITDGTDRFIGLESHDGFDAARILLPRVREFASTKLGKTYFAGIPNRDFLILWSKECSRRFQEYAIEKIETDYSIQNYPLTSCRFELNDRSITLYHAPPTG